jgi:hypothetical protein
VIDTSHPEAGRRAHQVARLLAADGAVISAKVIPVWTQADLGTDGDHDDRTGWIVSGRTRVGCDELIAFLWSGADCS